MKQINMIILLLFILLICSGCALEAPNYISTEAEQRKIATEILRCFDQEDNTGLKNIFCDKIISDYLDIDDDIFKAMEFFKGNVISYDDKVSISTSDGQSIQDGSIVKIMTSGEISTIITNQDNQYTIVFYNYLIYDEKPERVGLSEITVINQNGEECIIGNYYLVNPEKK